MSEKFYQVTQYVYVDLDESKLTDTFMELFRKNFYPFYSIEEHREHLAQLYARGLVDEYSEFIEGYGNPKEFGISFREHCSYGVEVEEIQEYD